jgi:ATP-dependent DNA ligase
MIAGEIKLDGYRLEAVQSVGRTAIYSWRQNVLTHKFPGDGPYGET